MTEKLDHNNGKKEKRIIKNCYNCEKIHTNKVKIKSYSIVQEYFYANTHVFSVQNIKI